MNYPSDFRFAKATSPCQGRQGTRAASEELFFCLVGLEISSESMGGKEQDFEKE